MHYTIKIYKKVSQGIWTFRSGSRINSVFLLIGLFIVFFPSGLYSQKVVLAKDTVEDVFDPEKWNVLWWSESDSLPIHFIEEVEIYQKPSFKSRRQIRKYNRLVRRVEKVYPYSKIIEEQLNTLARRLEYVDSEIEKKKIIKQTEKQLFAEFEGEVRRMTRSEGRILVKLIDRQTGNSSYEIIREMRGSFQAFFWQSIAMLFGNNLKDQYDIDNNEEDRMIEDIVMRLERNEKDLFIQ